MLNFFVPPSKQEIRNRSSQIRPAWNVFHLISFSLLLDQAWTLALTLFLSSSSFLPHRQYDGGGVYEAFLFFPESTALSSKSASWANVDRPGSRPGESILHFPYQSLFPLAVPLCNLPVLPFSSGKKRECSIQTTGLFAPPFIPSDCTFCLEGYELSSSCESHVSF